ncbi:MAG: Rrf2 family transcriptional regulator [SAR324 cluster bacterium]|nr:Rrf2 family transcriptional regulator [SAR324 cluster bacterium]
MLKLSKKVDYAIILLIHLGKSGNPVSAQEIAGMYQLPGPMIANILKQLASNQMIQSRRGQQGGYLLNKLPEEITLVDVIQSIDGNFNLVECADDGGCRISGNCPTKGPLAALHNQLKQFMETITLASMIQQQY